MVLTLNSASVNTAQRSRKLPDSSDLTLSLGLSYLASIITGFLLHLLVCFKFSYHPTQCFAFLAPTCFNWPDSTLKALVICRVYPLISNKSSQSCRVWVFADLQTSGTPWPRQHRLSPVNIFALAIFHQSEASIRNLSQWESWIVGRVSSIHTNWQIFIRRFWV